VVVELIIHLAQVDLEEEVDDMVQMDQTVLLAHQVILHL
jgi:hypothetical protein